MENDNIYVNHYSYLKVAEIKKTTRSRILSDIDVNTFDNKKRDDSKKSFTPPAKGVRAIPTEYERKLEIKQKIFKQCQISNNNEGIATSSSHVTDLQVLTFNMKSKYKCSHMPIRKKENSKENADHLRHHRSFKFTLSKRYQGILSNRKN